MDQLRVIIGDMFPDFCHRFLRCSRLKSDIVTKGEQRLEIFEGPPLRSGPPGPRLTSALQKAFLTTDLAETSICREYLPTRSNKHHIEYRA